MTSEIIRAVKEMLEPVCTSTYFGRSAAVYPKIVCDLRQVSAEDEKNRYRLILDLYVEAPIIEAVRLAERAREALHKKRGATESGYIAVWHGGSGYYIPEKDNDKIAHYTDSYEVAYFSGKE